MRALGYALAATIALTTPALAQSSKCPVNEFLNATGAYPPNACGYVNDGSHITNNSIPNNGLTHPSTTVNGQTCTLGATCTISAAASGITIGSTTITGGAANNALIDNGSSIAELPYGATGNSTLVETTAGGIITPALITGTGTLTAGTTGAGFTLSLSTSTITGHLTIANGGTNCIAASVTCLNNITGLTYPASATANDIATLNSNGSYLDSNIKTFAYTTPTYPGTGNGAARPLTNTYAYNNDLQNFYWPGNTTTSGNNELTDHNVTFTTAGTVPAGHTIGFEFKPTSSSTLATITVTTTSGETAAQLASALLTAANANSTFMAGSFNITAPDGIVYTGLAGNGLPQAIGAALTWNPGWQTGYAETFEAVCDGTPAVNTCTIGSGGNTATVTVTVPGGTPGGPTPNIAGMSNSVQWYVAGRAGVVNDLIEQKIWTAPDNAAASQIGMERNTYITNLYNGSITTKQAVSNGANGCGWQILGDINSQGYTSFTPLVSCGLTLSSASGKALNLQAPASDININTGNDVIASIPVYATNKIYGGFASGTQLSLLSTSNGSPSGDSVLVEGSTITLRNFAGTSTINMGVAGASGAQIVMAGTGGGSQTFQASTGTASGTITLPNGTHTLTPSDSPTFSGTVTMPDSGTWAPGGINGSIIGATTPAAGTFVKLTATSHILATSAAPSISACGTGSPSVSGSDNFGVVTAGTVATSCVINFGTTWGAAPSCAIASNTAITSPTVSSTTTQLTITGSALGGDKITWVCGATS